MNILFVSEYYYPIVSGVPVVVRYLAENLTSHGHNVSVVTQKTDESNRYELLNGVSIYRFPIYSDWKHSYRGNIAEYVDFVLNYKADVIIMECAECITTDLLIPHLKKIESKILFHAHGLSGFDNKPFAIKENLKHTLGSTYNWLNSKIYFNISFKNVFRYADAFMCLSSVDSGIEYMKKYARKLYILENAADDIFYKKNIKSGAIDKYTKLENKKYMMCCANYTVVKNQKDMISQYYQSHSSKDYSLVCIGSTENDYLHECKELVESLERIYGHRDVRLLHGIKRSDIPSIIKGSSLYLVTSRWEQYSISIIEAMSQGVPFISTNVGNARLLPGGVTVSKINEYHKYIDMILNHESKYKELANNGLEYSYRNCRIESVVGKLETILQEILKDNEKNMFCNNCSNYDKVISPRID